MTDGIKIPEDGEGTAAVSGPEVPAVTTQKILDAMYEVAGMEGYHGALRDLFAHGQGVGIFNWRGRGTRFKHVPLLDLMYPRKIHKRGYWDWRGAYHNRIQKKWDKKAGYKPVMFKAGRNYFIGSHAKNQIDFMIIDDPIIRSGDELREVFEMQPDAEKSGE